MTQKHLLNSIKIPFLIFCVWAIGIKIEKIFSDGSTVFLIVDLVIWLLLATILTFSFLSRRRKIIIENTPFDVVPGDLVELKLCKKKWYPATVVYVKNNGVTDSKYQWLDDENTEGIAVEWNEPQAIKSILQSQLRRDIKRSQQTVHFDYMVLKGNDKRFFRKI